MNELTLKLERIESLLRQKQLQALLLEKVSSFAWATCGARSYVNTAATSGAASLLITPDRRYVLTNNIEATRLELEERLQDQGWDIRYTPWHQPRESALKIAAGLALGADGPVPGAVDLSAEISALRMRLTPQEGERFRQLGRLSAQSMDRAIRRIQPGMSEFQIAALGAAEMEAVGAQAIVNLVATDERVFTFRHPLPTGKKLENYAMLVLCGRWQGLVCSNTRLVHFGRIPDEIQRKAAAVARVDATMIAATRPGQTLGQVFDAAVIAYEQSGYPGEWQLHHQGGPVAYEPREMVAVPGSVMEIEMGQAFAWNPSISGAKSEDTILVGEAGNEVLTTIPGWPVLAVELKDQVIERPAILEIE